MQTGQSETDRAYAEILVARGYLDAIQVEKAQARLSEAREQGTASSLIELLLEEGLLDPDLALAVRAEFDVQRQGKGETTRAAPPASIPPGEDGPQEDEVQPQSAEWSHHPSAEATLTAVNDSGDDRPMQPPAAVPALQQPASGEESSAPTKQRHSASPAAALHRQGDSGGDTSQASSSPSKSSATTRGRDATSATPSGSSGRKRVSHQDPLIGQVLGGCQLLEKIGEGGMGAVYRGQHLGLEKTVAVKVLPPATTKTQARVERFRREAKSAARIEHPNIVQILNVGEAQGHHFIVMQYIDGIDLRHRLKRRGTLSPEELVDTARQIAEGLKIAHDAGIVHRDIKPDNIMFDQDGRVKITDFGLAKALDDTDTTTTQPGRAVGTPYYMSPEQCAGKTVDERSDIYSLGATLYHVLTGQRPFKGETPVQTALMHLREPLKPPRSLRPDVPEVLDEFICKMMAKDPAKRQQHCHELLGEIAAMEQHMEVEARLRGITPTGQGSHAAARTLPLSEGGGAATATLAGAQHETVSEEQGATAATSPEGAEASSAPSGSTAGFGVAGTSGTGAAEAERAATVSLTGGPSTRPFVLLAALLAGGLFAGILIGLLSANDATDWGLGDNEQSPPGTGEGPPPDNGNGSEPGAESNNQGTPSDRQPPERDRQEEAKAHWLGLELTLAEELDEGHFLHVLREIDAFLEEYGDTPSGDEARQMQESVRNAARASYGKQLDERRGELEPLLARHRYGEALERLRARDPRPELDRLELDDLAASYGQLLVSLQERAHEYVATVLGEAHQLAASHPPQWYAALDVLAAAEVVGLEELVAQLRQAREEIKEEIASAQEAVHAALLAQHDADAQRANRFSERLEEIEPQLDTLAGIRALREELADQWRPASPQELLAASIERLDAELAQLEALHGEIADNLEGRNRHEIYLFGDEEEMLEVRILEVEADAGRVVAELESPREEGETVRTLRFAELSLRTIQEWISSRFERDHPLALGLFALARGEPYEGGVLGARSGHGVLAPYTSLGRAWRLLAKTQRLLFAEKRGEDLSERARALREEAYEEIEQLDPRNAPVKLARARLLAGHFGELRLAQEQLDKIPETYFAQPLFTLTRAEIALRLTPPAPDVAGSAVARWLTATYDAFDNLPKEEWRTVDKYYRSRALLYRSKARMLEREQQGRPLNPSRERIVLEDARRLDPSARDIYDALRALKRAQ